MSVIAGQMLPHPSGAHLTAARGRARTSRIAFAGTCVLIAAAPFEASRPLIQVPGQAVSSVEAVLFLVLAMWVASLMSARERPAWKAPLTLPWALFLVLMLIAAAAAPASRINALHMVGRLSLAFSVYLLTLNGITTASRLRSLLTVGASIGTLVSLIAILEYAGVPLVLDALRLFRPGIAVVGAQVRAAGPFQYPTIASMYLEILFAFSVGLLLMAIDARERRRAFVFATAPLVIAEAITLTFTRAGLITMGSTIAIVGAIRLRRHGADAGVKALAVIALAVAAALVTSRSVESLRLRLTTEGRGRWYHATFDAPLQLAMTTGEIREVPVTVTNAGLTTWDQAADLPYRLSYHWLLSDEDAVVSWEGLQTGFPAPVPPGGTASLVVRVEAPNRPGEYRLLWDIEQGHRLWFSSEPDAELFASRVGVSGPELHAGSWRVMPFPRREVRPGRVVLWRTAARMLRARPVVGIGPDNFRLMYGRYAGLINADTRVHANDMYIEMLVGGGLAAGAAFAWLCWRALTQFLRTARAAATPQIVSAGAAAAAAGAAIALHGVVDSFLSFTPTYILIAVTLGLGAGSGALNGSHADRL